MSRGYVVSISLLAAVWGASYLFIKVAVRDVEPATLVFIRVALVALLLVPFVLATRGVRRGAAELRAAAVPALVLGTINAAIPFTLIAWGETHIDSGVAAVANATVPLFVVLVAIRVRPSERATGARLAGIVLGLVGVVLLAGTQPGGGWWAVAGTLAVVLASLSYACGALYGQGRSGELAGPVWQPEPSSVRRSSWPPSPPCRRPTTCRAGRRSRRSSRSASAAPRSPSWCSSGCSVSTASRGQRW